MKRNFKYTGIILVLISTMLLNACKENIDPVIDQLDFDRAFTPFEFKAQITNVTTVTLSWKAAKNIDHYVVEIYEGTTFEPSAMVYTTELEADETSFEYLLPAGDTQFSARIKAVSTLEGVADSKWAIIEFKSGPENLFTGFLTQLTGLGELTVRWTPGKTVTALVFDDGVNETPYTISAQEMTNGEKSLTGVPNAKYEIRIVNGEFSRGKQNFVVEGDALLAAGGNLNAAMDALPAGGVLILTNGASYALTEPDTVTVSIKIRGLYPDNLPVIYLATGGGNHMFDIDPAMTLSDSLVFENVQISGYYDDAGVTRHRGFIDQEATGMNIGLIKFNNCVLRNSGRSAIRLRGTPTQYIDNVVFNDCILYDFAFDSHYGVLNGAATGNFGNIKFTNSTIYNIRGGIINYGSGAGCLSVLADNCTFDRTMMDGSTGRYFIDFGTSNTSAGTITISDCIFGQSSAVANGIRNNLMTLTVSGSYYTSDFVTVNAPFSGSMTSYGGASTGLWTNPVGGIFTFLDAGFAGKETAGDPRWK
jgi:hypothetical protein